MLKLLKSYCSHAILRGSACFALLLSTVLIGCNGDSGVAQYKRLESVWSPEKELTSADSIATDTYFDMLGIVGETYEEKIEQLPNTKFHEVFGRDVEKYWHSDGTLAKELAELERHFHEEFPDASTTYYYGVVLPFNQSIITSDSITFVVLNHYLGSGYEGYSHLSATQRKSKEPTFVARDVAFAKIMDRMAPAPIDADFSQLLLRSGAVDYAVRNLVPSMSLAEYFGVDSDRMSQMIEQEKEVWQELADDGVMFSNTSPERVDRYEMLRYIGLRIVESYVGENKDVSFDFILSRDFWMNPKSLILSGYSSQEK